MDTMEAKLWATKIEDAKGDLEAVHMPAPSKKKAKTTYTLFKLRTIFTSNKYVILFIIIFRYNKILGKKRVIFHWADAMCNGEHGG
jgi:hypothetical protein